MNKERINELRAIIPNEIWNEATGNAAENGFESDFETLKEAIRLLSVFYEEELILIGNAVDEWDENPIYSIGEELDETPKEIPWPNYEE